MNRQKMFIPYMRVVRSVRRWRVTGGRIIAKITAEQKRRVKFGFLKYLPGGRCPLSQLKCKKLGSGNLKSGFVIMLFNYQKSGLYVFAVTAIWEGSFVLCKNCYCTNVRKKMIVECTCRYYCICFLKKCRFSFK